MDLKVYCLQRGLFTGALELVGEFLHASSGINQAFFASISWMRIHRHIAHDYEVFLTINLLLAGRLHGGLRQESFACGNVEETNIIKSGMSGGFHGIKWLINPDAPCSGGWIC